MSHEIMFAAAVLPGALVGILGAALIFGLAIFFHELGHFVFAKIGGVGVREFAIGMGPKLFSVRYGETDYSIRAIPIGGFVALEGALPEGLEEEEGAEKADDPAKAKDMGSAVMEDVYALRNKGVVVKVSIFAAGVFFNYLAATAAMGVKYSVGVMEEKPTPSVVGRVAPGSVVESAGLKRKDRIVEALTVTSATLERARQEARTGGEGALDGEPTSASLGRAFLAISTEDAVTSQMVADWDDFWTFIATRIVNKDASPVILKGERNGAPFAISLPSPYPPADSGDQQVAYPSPNDPKRSAIESAFAAEVRAVIPNAPAERAGIQPRDLIVAVNDKPIEYFCDMAPIVGQLKGEAIKVEIRRPGVDGTKLVYPIVKADGMIGILGGEVEFMKEPPLTAFAKAPRRSAEFAVVIAVMTVKTLGRLVTHFKETKEEIGGPVAIMSMAYKASRQGLEQFLHLFIVLNLALLAFNLLPIPVLDGGHIMITLIEGIVRRPIPPRALIWTYNTVAILLISLVLLITYRDVMVWWLKF